MAKIVEIVEVEERDIRRQKRKDAIARHPWLVVSAISFASAAVLAVTVYLTDETYRKEEK